MLIVRSRNGVPVRLTEERWQHIVRRHLEMDNQRELVLETLAEPDMIQLGDSGELLAIRFYPDDLSDQSAIGQEGSGVVWKQ